MNRRSFFFGWDDKHKYAVGISWGFSLRDTFEFSLFRGEYDDNIDTYYYFTLMLLGFGITIYKTEYVNWHV